MAETDEAAAEKELRSAEAIALAATGARTVTEMKALAREDTRSARARDRHGDAYSYRKLVSALAENIETDAFLLSREITRRTAEAPRDRRAARKW